jgi:hypothetical protein
MTQRSWPSLALGAALGSAATAAILLLPCGDENVGNQQPAEHPATAGPAATLNRDSPGLPEAKPSSATKPGSGDQTRGQEGQAQVVHWLSGKLEEAYETEALPEIIGSQAGQAAGQQTLDYMFEDYDTQLLQRELDAALAGIEDLARLEEPWQLAAQGRDCQQAPCLLRLEIEGGGDARSCNQAFRQMLSRLDAATSTAILQVENISQRGGGCGATLDVHTERSQQRWQELTDGIEGFLQRVGAATEDRREALQANSSPN